MILESKYYLYVCMTGERNKISKKMTNQHNLLPCLEHSCGCNSQRIPLMGIGVLDYIVCGKTPITV